LWKEIIIVITNGVCSQKVYSNMTPLNPKLFDIDVEQAPIRAGFGEGLVRFRK